jgi:signal transduction histidine kinase
MRAIVGDLLFMARPVDKVQTHVDVQPILESTIALMRAGGVSLPVSVELEPLPPIQGFASKLGQVFLNLLRNAAEAVDGRADASIRVRGRADADAIELVFEDDGPGIPEALLAEVTRPFFTTKPQGVGLGLWISQSLVADHGGTLDVASAHGKGTTVTLRLPLVRP